MVCLVDQRGTVQRNGLGGQVVESAAYPSRDEIAELRLDPDQLYIIFDGFRIQTSGNYRLQVTLMQLGPSNASSHGAETLSCQIESHSIDVRDT
jgi:hypothetical protein